MKKAVIGIIYSGRITNDEKFLMELSRKKKVSMVFINTDDRFDEKALREKVGKCDIIYNSSAEDFSLEFVKMIEEWGKRIIEPSDSFYYTEDKWMFYLKCEEHKIPVPKTILLSQNIGHAKKGA